MERAAVCALKSKVFMEYPPIGNKIALELAESARKLNDTEILWKTIWLQAKGRTRRYDNSMDRTYKSMPLSEELSIANLLSSYENRPELWMIASDVFREAGIVFRYNFSPANIEESDKYFQLSVALLK